MTNKELWELRLSLIKDVMTLTDKQLQYITDQMNAAQGPAGAHTEALPRRKQSTLPLPHSRSCWPFSRAVRSLSAAPSR